MTLEPRVIDVLVSLPNALDGDRLAGDLAREASELTNQLRFRPERRELGGPAAECARTEGIPTYTSARREVLVRTQQELQLRLAPSRQDLPP